MATADGRAAMEPVLGGRDDLRWWLAKDGFRWAAMEPVLGGRDDGASVTDLPRPAVSRNGARPWRTGRRLSIGITVARGRSRNGARPWRTGRPVQPVGAFGPSGRPQWSPSLADGTTCSRPCSASPGTGRNGARPWRTGRPIPAWPRRSPSTGRNGARPWRTGRRSIPHALQAIIAGPQWSPSLADGTTDYARPVWYGIRGRNGARPWRTGRPTPAGSMNSKLAEPQWSPSLADGTTRTTSRKAEQPVLAAMEPVLGGRDDRRQLSQVRCPQRSRNGARPWRTGRR